MGLTKITSRILDSSGVTILGTIATGVWQGTAINQTYLVGQSGTNTGDETLARINALDVTELGTISSGVWNGTAINQTYLVGQSGTNTGDQTTISGNAGTVTNGVYTVGNQTIAGVKTFSNGVTISGANNTASKLILTNTASSNTWSFNPEYNSQDFTISEDANPRITLKSGGNVGIGAISPDSKHEIVGLRPGEKIHEQMIGYEDAAHTFEYDKHYKILPAIHDWSKDPNRIKDGKAVPEDFIYSSDNNSQWMTKRELSNWIESKKDSLGVI